MEEEMYKEEIVMTPTKKGKTTLIKIEKVRRNLIDSKNVAHQGGGQNSGLVINKKAEGEGAGANPPQLQLEFKCFLVDKTSGKHIPESRVLKFWFHPDTDYLDKVTGAYEFFKELVRPDQFPRDYVGFIKKVMKQLQAPKYTQIKHVDVELTQLDIADAPPPSPGEPCDDVGDPGLPKEDSRPKEVVVQEQLLQTLESAYPNIMPVEDLARHMHTDELQIEEGLKMLSGRNLIRELEPGKWVRKVLDNKTEVKVVKNMPANTGERRPTIAVITSKYYEKLALDSMMDDKTTYVKFKSEGESNVYTIGTIGAHRVVSTKLPAIGRQRAAQISSGNTTTRLLGSFSDIEHVLLVGVCGGVPHYTDYYKHARLGDIIVGTPNQKGNMYIYCDKLQQNAEAGSIQYALKSWAPADVVIQKTVEEIIEETKDGGSPWERYIEEGQGLLHDQEVTFTRPAASSDKLYMNIGGNDVIEVGHPPMPEDAVQVYREGVPQLRCGAIGSGKPIVHDDALRLDFATRHQCTGFDTEFDQVLESINGNRQDSFAFIRGVCDYLDGTKNVEWQPYSALAAAAFTKTLIEHLPPPGYVK